MRSAHMHVLDHHDAGTEQACPYREPQVAPVRPVATLLDCCPQRHQGPRARFLTICFRWPYVLLSKNAVPSSAGPHLPTCVCWKSSRRDSQYAGMHVYTDASTVRKHDENAARCRLPVLLASAVPGPQTSKQARGVGQVRTRGWACRQRVIGSNHTPHRRAGLVTLDHHRGLPKELRHVVVPLGVAERKGGLRRALVVLRRLHTRFSFATECSCCVTVTLSALDSPPRASRPRARIEEACRYPCPFSSRNLAQDET